MRAVFDIIDGWGWWSDLALMVLAATASLILFDLANVVRGRR